MSKKLREQSSLLPSISEVSDTLEARNAPLPYVSSAKRPLFESGRIYSITAVTHRRQPWFHDFFVGRLVIDELRLAEEQGLANSLCWVVMPDHFHWLLQLRQCDLERLLQQVKSRSAKAINQRLQRSGKIWQSGYHDRTLRREEDIRDIARYIVANPLRAGLVKQLANYPLWDAVFL